MEKSTNDNDNYERPSKTQTDTLSKKDIMKLLEQYNKIDISKIPVGSHVRYFINADTKPKFRYGGTLINNDGLPTYVVLTNGKQNWSVQTANTVFWLKMTFSDFKKRYDDTINELKNTIGKLEDKNRRLEIELNKYKKR